jgi:hypothetical protein
VKKANKNSTKASKDKNIKNNTKANIKVSSTEK